jgi:hypothetical protein
MPRFGHLLGAGKTNNHGAATKAKAEIRRRVMVAIGAERAVVFDAFAGDGAMHRAVWHQAAGYVGCDLKWYRDDREAFVADNRRVLRAINLVPFTIFDLDAWGSPWEQAVIVAARRPVAPGELVGLVLTEGSGLRLRMGGYPAALRLLAGVRQGATGGARSHEELTGRAIAGLCRRMQVRPVRRWQASRPGGAMMQYIGLVLEGEPRA